MKNASAWFLLLICTVQWIGGHFIFELEYWSAVYRKMNLTEQAISLDLARETGLSTNIKVLEADAPAKRGMHYGDFVFSSQLGDSTVHFSLVQQGDTVDFRQVKASVPPDHAKDPKMALLKSLFQEFTLPAPWMGRQVEDDHQISYFFEPYIPYLVSIPIISPPPELAAA